MSWINPKTNWLDIDFYNVEDINRVENNTRELADELIKYMYLVPLEPVVTDRTIASFDFISSINRIERNIEIIKNSFITPDGWQAMKTWELGNSFAYQDANRLEQNLLRLYDLLQLAKKNYIYSGTFTCGADWEGGLY